MKYSFTNISKGVKRKTVLTKYEIRRQLWQFTVWWWIQWAVRVYGKTWIVVKSLNKRRRLIIETICMYRTMYRTMYEILVWARVGKWVELVICFILYVCGWWLKLWNLGVLVWIHKGQINLCWKSDSCALIVWSCF